MGPQAVAFIAVTVELPEPDVWKTDCHRRPETGVKAGEWLLGGTAMSKSYIPPEILDYTVDLLHDEPEPLEECCLVSKSWIPCTRKHLFAEVRFHSEEDVELWKKTFPDPSTSPGCYTRTLSVSVGTARFRATDAGAGGWVGGFSRVVCLVLHGQVVDINRLRFSLVPLHGFSPALKSIRMDGVILPSSQIFGLVLSFPILDDLVVIAYDTLIGDDDGSDELPAIIQPSSLPKFAGSLDIPRRAGVRPILRWLLSLPGNIHFRKLTLVWSCEEDISLTTALVERCSHTLESLKITCTPFAGQGPALIDLSRVAGIKSAAFGVQRSRRVDWITMTLRTITPKHRDFQEISIYLEFDRFSTLPGTCTRVRQTIGEQFFEQWLEFDHLLAKFWETRSIRLKALYYAPLKTEKMVMEYMGFLLPEITERGIIDLAEWVL